MQFLADLTRQQTWSFDSGRSAVALQIRPGSSREFAALEVLTMDEVTRATYVETVDLLTSNSRRELHLGSGFSTTAFALLQTDIAGNYNEVLLQHSSEFAQDRLRFSRVATRQHLKTVPLNVSSNATVPDWYDENRVQLHSRISPVRSSRKQPGYYDRDESLMAASGVESLGAHVLTRHFKSGDIAYYWLISEAALAAEHPEWVCRSSSGTPIASNRGAYLDITSEYGQISI